jgi:signal transduction histidine kinase
MTPLSGRAVSILLVEDNPGDARLLRETLREAPSFRHALTHVERLAEAQARLRAEGADVLLLDLSLPDAHGLDTVERASEAAPDVPIIVLTGLDDQTVALQAVQAGAQDYLVKGQFDATLLTRSIRYAMERKRLERERLLLLEREQEARLRAETAVRARDDVLRVVSHDLGNSLSAISIHTAVLLRTLGPESADALERIGNIRDLARQMARLRQDLLDVASIEAGRLSIEPEHHEPSELMETALEHLRPLAAVKAIGLRTAAADDLPLVMVDPERMLQVLANLGGNAIKFTPEGGEVVLRVERVEESVCFVVRDTGPGIEPEHLSHVFDRFWKVRERNRGGTGLGLAIAKGIVEAHGGRIWAESQPGAGSTFRFTIPAAEPAEPA